MKNSIIIINTELSQSVTKLTGTIQSVSALSCSHYIDWDHSDSKDVVKMFNGVIQHDILYKYCCIASSNGDIVAQDGYPLQSEGRTPGDEDSSGIDENHSEVTD